MADFKIGQLVTGDFEGIGIISDKWYDDGDLVYRVTYKDSYWGNTIGTCKQYEDDLTHVKGAYEVEITALGVGSFTTQFKAKSQEEAEKWVENFIAANAVDPLGRTIDQVWRNGAKSKNLIVTYIKKVS